MDKPSPLAPLSNDETNEQKRKSYDGNDNIQFFALSKQRKITNYTQKKSFFAY